jgi:hypothetical protein
MKHPPVQMDDKASREQIENFLKLTAGAKTTAYKAETPAQG